MALSVRAIEKTLIFLTEIDSLESYKNIFKEVIDVFINHLSEKFHSDSYKPLISISVILTENEKPALGNIF